MEKRYEVYVCEICGHRHEMGVVVTGLPHTTFSCLECGHKINWYQCSQYGNDQFTVYMKLP